MQDGTSARCWTSYATLRWALIPVIAAHNFEEWLTFPVYGEAASVLASRLGVEFAAPAWGTLQAALILVTVIPALIVVWASTGRQHRTKDLVLCAVASIFLVNVFVPHLPAAIAIGGYTPGLLTAVGINLWFVPSLLMAAVREQVLPAKVVWRAVAIGALALPVGIIGTLAVSSILVDRF